MATATLMPNPRFVVEDANGAPVSGALIHTYIPGGTTPKASWQDAAETIPNSNPIVCDSAGSCLLYGSGSYQLTVTDANGVAVPGYSGVTADTLSPVTAEAARATAAEAAIIASFPHVAAAAGYQVTFATIMQWGNATTSGGGGVTVTYPIAFPNGVFSVLASCVNGGAAPTSLLATTSVNTTSFGVGSSDSASHAFVPGISFYWLAIGH